MTKFEAGKTYNGRFISDADSVISVTVIKRTAKTAVVKVDGEREEKRVRIQEHDGSEFVFPMGSGYSMAPRVYANREV